MRGLIFLSLLALAACGSANRTDGVTPAEAAQLNAAADKLDFQQANAVR
jgi:hypothetical protein